MPAIYPDPTPVRPNSYLNAFPGQFPGSPTDTLKLYRALMGEEGYGLALDYNFAILDNAALRDWDNTFLKGTVQTFAGQVLLKVWPTYSAEAAVPRLYVDNLASIMGMGGF